MTDGFQMLAPYRQQIDAAMGQLFDDLPSLFDLELSEHSIDALEKLRAYSVSPGKRLRGSLAAATYDIASGETYGANGLQIGVALELMQNYLLIVDDVMDRSDLRRGLPTLHHQYLGEDVHDRTGHEADMLAVNVGILSQHLANLVIARLDAPPDRVRQALEVMHNNIAATGFGQLDDLHQQLGRQVSHDDIIRKYRLKNSYYTFVNPIQMGFIVAGKSDKKLLADCRRFGEPAGIAFQLHDDYLGIFGEAELLGKPNLDDIREGKYTFLVQYALEHGSAEDADVLQKILGNMQAGETDLTTVREIFTRSNAKSNNQEQAKSYAAQAKKVLETGTLHSYGQLVDVLEAIVDFSIARNR